ncbi:hypothetical protein Tco_1294434 [Tanacetum coccineum]
MFHNEDGNPLGQHQTSDLGRWTFRENSILNKLVSTGKENDDLTLELENPVKEGFFESTRSLVTVFLLLRTVLRNRGIHKDGDGDAYSMLKSDSIPNATCSNTKEIYKHLRFKNQ